MKRMQRTKMATLVSIRPEGHSTGSTPNQLRLVSLIQGGGQAGQGVARLVIGVTAARNH
jgi:hypothetical protein